MEIPLRLCRHPLRLGLMNPSFWFDKSVCMWAPYDRQFAGSLEVSVLFSGFQDDTT